MTVILIRTVIIYFSLIIAMRLMGKRQIGELEVSDLVTTLIVSEIAALPISDNTIPIMHAIIPIIILLFFEVFSSMLLAKCPRLKGLVSGNPTILINQGRINKKALVNSRISVDELVSQLRQKDITDIAEVHYAILEQNGRITVVPKASAKQPTVKQMDIKAKESGISHIMISQGRINKYGLRLKNTDKKAILHELALQNLNLKDVFLMTIDDDGKTQIIERRFNMKSFIAATILFCLLIGIIIINSIYTKKIAEELEDKILALDFENEITDDIDSIQKYWKKKEKVIGISVGFKEIDKTSELIIALKVHYQYQNREEFEKAKLLLIDVIDEITRLEKLSFR